MSVAAHAALDALLAPGGQRLLEDARRALDEGDDPLGLSGRLRTRHPELAADLVAAALSQLTLRARARAKFRLADQMWFTREGLEQASSERMAALRAARYEPYPDVADLCTGIGGDLVALAKGRRVLAVDRDPLHLRMAELNARAHGCAQVRTRCEDVAAVPLTGVSAVFVDPARREGARRLPAGRSQPPLDWCLGLMSRVPAVGIKAAPGLPLALVPAGWEVEFVSEAADLAEARLWSPALATATRRATVLPGGETLTGRGVPEQDKFDEHEVGKGKFGEVRVAAPGAHLLDPDPAVTRAGLVEELAVSLGAWKIDDRIAFLSADAPLRTPFGRSYRVEASLPWQLKRLRTVLRERGIGAVDVRKRGSAVDVDDLARRLRLEGDRRATVVLTRVGDRPWALVCTLDPS